MLGDPRFALWNRLGLIAKHNEDVPWHTLWRAADELINQGFNPRDKRVLDRARELARQERAYMEQRARRETARERRDDADSGPTAESQQ